MIYEYINIHSVKAEDFVLARTGDLLWINNTQLINLITGIAYRTQTKEGLQQILDSCREISRDAYYKRLDNIEQVKIALDIPSIPKQIYDLNERLNVIENKLKEENV